MEPDLLAIARRHLDRTRAPGGEIEDKGEKPATGTPLSPLSSFSPPAVSRSDWGCHREEMLRLVLSVDEFVERSGVSGRHPVIKAAVNMVVSATLTCDIETVRYAVAEFRVAVASVIAACK